MVINAFSGGCLHSICPHESCAKYEPTTLVVYDWGSYPCLLAVCWWSTDYVWRLGQGGWRDGWIDGWWNRGLTPAAVFYMMTVVCGGIFCSPRSVALVALEIYRRRPWKTTNGGSVKLFHIRVGPLGIFVLDAQSHSASGC